MFQNQEAVLAQNADGHTKRWLWPWEMNPFRLWSAIDLMKIFDAQKAAHAVANLAITGSIASNVEGTLKGIENSLSQTQKNLQVNGVLINIPISQMGDLEEAIWDAAKQKASGALGAAEESLKDSVLSDAFKPKIERLHADVGAGNLGKISARSEELASDVLRELSRRLFLIIDPDKAEMFEQRDGPPFGQAVADAFLDSAKDIASAARCFALNEWTACVMHLMRALESPLQIMATKLNVSFPGPTDLENWKTIVDQMISKADAESKQLEQQPKSHPRNQELKLLAEVALQMRHFKNAWRNNVAHGRDHYDERDAEKVFRAVKDFTQTMALIAPAPPSLNAVGL